ncbi:Rho GTPase-activating protein 11A [Nibea albiflora]|uniref:Rho GTPase-activating protein 11A n=1 Tax=Nibea albiflora TaxID=240163 RepID=A0ACB7FGI5_NIBAL|nr:Rho GTPase-activating protein 11A [Nibea albiflora]
MLVIKGSESIGWRLATQESTASFRFTKETEFSPSGLPRKAESKSSNYISKSEDNLLTPQCNSSAHRTSWSGETPVGAQAFSGSFTDTPMNMRLKSNYMSEPAIVVSKPPAMGGLPKKLCCASSAESLESESSISEAQSRAVPILLNIKTGLAESHAALREQMQQSHQTAIFLPPPETPTVKVSVDTEASSFPTQQSLLAKEQNITFGQIEIAALTPLHIDSVVFESGVYCSPVKADKGSFCAAPISSHNSSRVEESEREVEQVNCSRLIDALDIQSPALFKPGVCSGLQSTPCKLDLEFEGELHTPRKIGTMVAAVHEKSEFSPEIGSQVQNERPLSPRSLETEKRRVVDHIQHFNKLTLHSPRGAKTSLIRSPLRFHRTPVRQTVRRINSLLGENRRPTRNVKFTSSQSGQVLKAVSLESGLSPHPHPQPQPHQGGAQLGRSDSTRPIKKPPPVPPKKPSTLARKPKACALGDVTNVVQPKTKVDCCDPDPPGAQKPLVQQVVEKDMSHYRGSPRNPLNQGRLLSATKPVDL